MKKVVILSFVIAVAAVLYGATKIFIPPSIEIYFASVAGCKFDEKALSENDSQFEKIKLWEYPLMHAYRFKHWYLSRNYIVSDWLVENQSVFHILVTSSDNTLGMCDENIIRMLKRYKEHGAPINHYNSQGFTALHEAVILQNISLSKALVESGSNVELRVNSSTSSINGLNVREIIELFASKNPNQHVWDKMNQIMSNEI